MEIYTKIQGELLSQKIFRILKDAIIEQKLKAGEKLSETEIAKQMGVSRTPVREALKELAARGFVNANPNQGMSVSIIDFKDVEEVLQIRSVIEGLAVELSIENINNKEIEEMEKIFSQMEHYLKENDILSFSKMGDEFHEMLFKIARNKRLLKLRNEIHDIELRFGIKSLNIPGRPEKSLAEQRKILNAIKERSPEEAVYYSKQHVINIIKNLRKFADEINDY